MKVNIKKIDQLATMPKYSRVGDAALDFVALTCSRNYQYIEYGTGIAMEIPEGYVGLIFPRSSLSNYDLVLSNSVGVIDSNYRGEIKFRFKITKDTATTKIYNVGDKIGQIIIIPIPSVELIEVEELSDSNRGNNGYGSSGV